MHLAARPEFPRQQKEDLPLATSLQLLAASAPPSQSLSSPRAPLRYQDSFPWQSLLDLPLSPHAPAHVSTLPIAHRLLRLKHPLRRQPQRQLQLRIRSVRPLTLKFELI